MFIIRILYVRLLLAMKYFLHCCIGPLALLPPLQRQGSKAKMTVAGN